MYQMNLKKIRVGVILFLCIVFLNYKSGICYHSDFKEITISKPIALCTLIIDKIVVGDCEFGPRTGNQSKLIVAVFLKWTDPVPGEKIEVRLKGQRKIHDPFMKACPAFVQFILDPDGMSYDVEAEFLTGNCAAIPQTIMLPLACDPPVCADTTSIGGKVYQDFNRNGIQEASENGMPGIEVRLYDDTKQLIRTAYTKTNGLWSVLNLPAGLKLRAEFQVPAGFFDANPGIDNRTRTQRSYVGNCKVDLGIYRLNSQIDENPWIVTTCFAKGDALNPASPSHTAATLVANRYNTTEGGPRTGPNGNYYLASAGETGSVWGLSFQKETRQLFSAAFIKRNASLGPGGLGAIYVTDLNNFLPNPVTAPGFRYYGRTSQLLNLDDFGIATGDENALFRNLPVSPLSASHDSISFPLIGKWGLGDIDINDAGDSLFVVNLYNRSLIAIHIGNPLQLPVTPDRVLEIPIPDPGCAASGDWRPWGLKYRDGRVYIGGVCSAESSGREEDLKAVVYAWDQTNFKQIVTFDLHYTKGFLNDNYCSTFRPWRDDFYSYYIFRDVVCGPVPVLSDIEFDSEGNMIVALGDRFGYQSGGRDYGTRQTDGLLYIAFSGGDNLKLFKLKDEYLLEQNATAGFYTTLGANNRQGVCGGEFFYQDGFYSHQESALGALAVHPSYNTVLSTMMDPANIWSNGWSQLDNATGTKRINYNVFMGEHGTFGKSAGLGDIEILIGSNSSKGIGVSIGNYIWSDLDGDGLQDPGEIPLANLPVLLFNSNDSLISQTLTDTGGLYFFKDLDANTDFILQIAQDSMYQNNELVFKNTSYKSTKLRTRLNFGNSENDSDASTSFVSSASFVNKIAFPYKTGDDGENDFSLDFGLIPCYLQKPDTSFINLCRNDSIQIGKQWFSRTKTSGEVKFPTPDGVGCDSVVLVGILLRDESHRFLDTSTCQGGVIKIANQIFDEFNRSGTLVLRSANSYGCDSSITVNLDILPYSDHFIDTAICSGQQIEIANEFFDENRTKDSILLSGANQFGCDSVIHVQLQILAKTQFRLDTATCADGQIIIANQVFDESNKSGTVVLPGANQFGCDSLILVNLVILPSSIQQMDTAICPGGHVVIANQVFDESKNSATVLLPGANQYGCDSVIHIKLRLKQISNKHIDTAVCPGGKVLIDSIQLDEFNKSDKLILYGSNHQGCDSIIHYNLLVYPQYYMSDTISSCVSYIWPVSGRQYQSSGVYQFNLKTNHGCDSIHQLQLRIHPDYHVEDTVCAIRQYTWSANGMHYFKSGAYQYNHRSRFGCDSIQSLILLIENDQIYMPNAFTPNGDGINDRFTVHSNEDVKWIDHFSIFDRWGEKVYEYNNFPPNDDLYGWDGIFKLQKANPAVFVYIVEWRDKLGGRHQLKGDVTLIR